MNNDISDNYKDKLFEGFVSKLNACCTVPSDFVQQLKPVYETAFQNYEGQFLDGQEDVPYIAYIVEAALIAVCQMNMNPEIVSSLFLIKSGSGENTGISDEFIPAYRLAYLRMIGSVANSGSEKLEKAGERLIICVKAAREKGFDSVADEIMELYRQKLYENFISQLSVSLLNSSAAMERITTAYNFAYDAHKNQARKGGNKEPYITHPVEVALIVANEMGLGVNAIEAALLHDVVEDTDYELEDIESRFGKKCAAVIDGLTKITNHEEVFSEAKSEQVETFKKILLSVRNTPLVVFIKIADRIHNMRTIGDMSYEQKRRKAGENLYMYVSLAEQLGLYDIRNELEDLSFKNFFTEIYQKLDNLVKETEEARHKLLSDFKMSLMRILVKTSHTCRLVVVKKSYYAIYQMMQNNFKSDEDIDNYQTVRIIFDREPGDDDDSVYHKHFDLYASIIKQFPEKENSRRDYINKPKENGFKALVFTVLYNGSWIEIQILTAENDLAAHKGYYPDRSERTGLKTLQKKMKNFTFKDSSDTIITSFRALTEHSMSSVFVYSIDGKIFELPSGATVLDFAYALGRNFGNHFLAAYVGSKLVMKNYVLKKSDKIKVLWSPAVKPEDGWNMFLKSGYARESLSRYIREHSACNFEAQNGEIEFNRIMREIHIIPTPRFLGELITHYNYFNSEEFYRAVRRKEIANLAEVAKKIKKGFSDGGNKVSVENDNSDHRHKVPMVMNVDYSKPLELTRSIPYVLPSCCYPVPGDKALAYIGGDGVLYVHRCECEHAKKRLATNGKKITSVVWSEDLKNALAYIYITGSDRLGLISDVADVFVNKSVSVKSFHIDEVDRLFNGWLLISIKNIVKLDEVMKTLSSVKNVINVKRVRTNIAGRQMIYGLDSKKS
jgi:GTP pyrophosphokinase